MAAMNAKLHYSYVLSSVLLFWFLGQLNICLYEFYCIVNLSNVPLALETYLCLWNSLITMFLCIYYLYFSWFSRKLLFAIARYSLRYNLLALGKNTPLFKTLVARKKSRSLTSDAGSGRCWWEWGFKLFPWFPWKWRPKESDLIENPLISGNK